ncbi:MAG: bifunctional protein-serine/threonine kinase/phosphatase [Pseudomonadales bacterium]|nr:bifunctional protein-serine/threonine kinase/phosphatase [Pseudomonadales bacterium]
MPDDQHRMQNKGIALAIADGVSTAEAGQEASLTAVNNFITDYYQTPDPWTVSHSGEKVLTAINLKLYRKSHEFANQEKGYLCTFSGLIIKSCFAHFFHAGDSRIYRLRNNELAQITQDHKAIIGNQNHILARAVGMDSSLQIDYRKQAIEENDIYFLSTDGIHDFLTDDEILDQLKKTSIAEERAKEIVNLALEKGSDDNISCIVAHIHSLPKQTLNDYNLKLTSLPFPPGLKKGMSIDGYRIDKEIFASSRSQLYLVTDLDNGNQFVMKTPSHNFEDDASYIDRFIQEEWIGKRIESPYVVKIVDQSKPRNFLYYLMEFVEGESLNEWMIKHPFPAPREAIEIVDQIAAGLKCFHEQETIHQDLKPGNVMISKDGVVKIVDFGSVYVAGIAEMFKPMAHEGALGTATYSDPQYLMGINSGIQGDIYALATIAYELFTGEIPYGKKIEECHAIFEYDRLRYRDARQFNPVIPLWFDQALKHGVAIHLEERYSTLESFMRDLHNPNPDYLLEDPEYTKDKNKALYWEIISGFWLLTLVLVVALFSCSEG